jgi:hypothetical protein
MNMKLTELFDYFDNINDTEVDIKNKLRAFDFKISYNSELIDPNIQKIAQMALNLGRDNEYFAQEVEKLTGNDISHTSFHGTGIDILDMLFARLPDDPMDERLKPIRHNILESIIRYNRQANITFFKRIIGPLRTFIRSDAYSDLISDIYKLIKTNDPTHLKEGLLKQYGVTELEEHILEAFVNENNMLDVTYKQNLKALSKVIEILGAKYGKKRGETRLKKFQALLQLNAIIAFGQVIDFYVEIGGLWYIPFAMCEHFMDLGRLFDLGFYTIEDMDLRKLIFSAECADNVNEGKWDVRYAEPKKEYKEMRKRGDSRPTTKLAFDLKKKYDVEIKKREAEKIEKLRNEAKELKGNNTTDEEINAYVKKNLDLYLYRPYDVDKLAKILRAVEKRPRKQI